jgi:hypothetical protein
MEPPRSSRPEPDQSAASDSFPGDQNRRASDADRERTASLLQAATADGRVSIGELEQRLDLVYRAKSQGELAAIVEDLRPARLASGTPSTAKDVGVLNGFVRQGHWLVGSKYRATALLSSGVVDLREAQFTGPQTTIHVNSWVSTVYVVVPEDAAVYVAGTGVLGGFEQDRESATPSAAVRIDVTGVACCGNVHVVHELPAAKVRRLRTRKGPGAGRKQLEQ